MRNTLIILLVCLCQEVLSDLALPFGYGAGDQFLRKDYDMCSIRLNLTRSFNVGNETYETLFVCDDGLLVLGETQPNYDDENWMVGTNTLLVTTAAFFSTFRLDYTVDYLCSMNSAGDNNLYDSLSYYEEPMCDYFYNNSYTFRHDDNNFTFYYPADIVSNAYNNQMFREIINDDNGDLSLITSLVDRAHFNASWAFVTTNYKLKTAQSILWRTYLTSQLTLACDGKGTSDNLSDDFCVIVFDLEDLPLVDNEGDFMHLGIDWDADDPLFELPYSGTMEVSKLVLESNWNIPGLWVYEVNQNGEGEAIRDMSRGTEVMTNAGKVLPILFVVNLMLQIVLE